mmetsp:Transcript_136502/g.323288  ORF Transcript_136502/g.323288 Transcript_136502/m.323288 type:complete len:201 (-) Transcript_136502:33-635(-)
MFDFTCVTSACDPPPPGPLTVKIDPAELAKRAAVDVAEFKLKEHQESERKAAEAKAEADRRAAEAKKQQEAERRRLEADARQAAEEAEKLRREADAKKATEDQEERQRRTEVINWLKNQGFPDIAAPKKTRSCMSTSHQYPLHKAVTDGNGRMVKLLLEMHADPKLKNSKGKTPLEVAKKTKTTASKEIISLLEDAAKRA